MSRRTGVSRARSLCLSLGLLAAASLLGAGFASPARADDSVRPQERAAFQMRVLQSDMMVGALLCGLNQQYDAAVRRFRPEMVAHARHLRSYFDRTHGRRGQVELDRFVTVLANRASTRATTLGGLFCAEAAGLMEAVLALPENGLGTFSQNTIGMPDLSVTTTASAR